MIVHIVSHNATFEYNQNNTKYTVSHSDLCFENILLDRNPFVIHRDESRTSYPFPIGLADDIVIKLVDFGVAQTSTRSLRDRLNVKHTIFQSPQIYEGEAYDPRAADCWSIGLLLYSAMTGLRLYTVEDIINCHRHRTAYRALQRDALRSYLKRHKLLTFSSECFALISGLLSFEEERRLTISDALLHRWFAPLNVNLNTPSLTVSRDMNSLNCTGSTGGIPVDERPSLFRGVLEDVLKLTTCYQPNLIEWSTQNRRTSSTGISS